MRETRPFPGMVEGLDRLAAMGFPLAVITNKASRFVHPHLERAHIARYFALIVGGDDLPAKKPEPAQLLHVAAAFHVPARRLLMVGDSGNDALAARAAGCPVLIVPHGYNEGEPVQNLDADGIVPSLVAIADRVRYVLPTFRELRPLRPQRPCRLDGVVLRERTAPLAPLTCAHRVAPSARRPPVPLPPLKPLSKRHDRSRIPRPRGARV
jgi:ribonucleotide monophosphatase NagD (HAD superfamily)